MPNETVIDWINEIAEFTEIHEFAQDKELDEALAMIVKIMMKPDLESLLLGTPLWQRIDLERQTTLRRIFTIQ